MEKCAFCGATEDLQTHHWLYNEEDSWTVTLCVNCHQKLHQGHGVGRGKGYSTSSYHRKPFAWDGKTIEKQYIIRHAGGTGDDETAEVTLPTAWKRYHKLNFGDTVKILADGVVIILPPNASEEKEAEVRRFLEGGNK